MKYEVTSAHLELKGTFQKLSAMRFYLNVIAI